MRHSRIERGQYIPATAILAALLVLQGCGGRTSAEASIPSSSVLGDRATLVELKVVSSGAGIVPPEGGECDPLAPDTTTVTTTPPRLTWDGCRISYDSGAVVKDAGSREITVVELATVVDALQRVVITDATSCGYDASVVTMDVTTSTGTVYYADDFYSGCPWGPLVGRAFVTGIEKILLPAFPPHVEK